jgi:hypothetical protein
LALSRWEANVSSLNALYKRLQFNPSGFEVYFSKRLLDKGSRYDGLFTPVKLWRLLDVAAAHEPEWSEERTDVGELESLKPRQLDGVVC